MQVQATGPRPKLSLAYGGAHPEAASQRRSATLSPSDLKRIVAGMIG